MLTARETCIQGQPALWDNLLPLLCSIPFTFTSKLNWTLISVISSWQSNHQNKLILSFAIFLFWQLSEAAEYARKKGVILKGDLPIGVDRNSVDTWVYPNLFRMNTSTGAPPDYFDKNGQNWGFPTYNWEEMSKDNYGWWRARLTQVLVLNSWSCPYMDNNPSKVKYIGWILFFFCIFFKSTTDGKIFYSLQDWSHIGILPNLGTSGSCCDRSCWKIPTIYSS